MSDFAERRRCESSCDSGRIERTRPVWQSTIIGGDTPIEEGLDAFVKKGETDWLG